VSLRRIGSRSRKRLSEGASNLTMTTTQHTDDDIDRDLYCLHCGYNLRGLSGDPRRCPECGYGNALSELTLPADVIQEQLRKMESAPTTCVAVVLVAGLLYAAFVLAVAGNLEAGDAYAPVVLGGLCVLAGVVGVGGLFWSVPANAFRESCQGNPAWRSALWEYHRISLVVAAPLASAILLFGLLPHSQARAMRGWILLIDAMLVVGALVAGRWVRGELKRIIDPLQRETAIRIARETLLKRMTREH